MCAGVDGGMLTPAADCHHHGKTSHPWTRLHPAQVPSSPRRFDSSAAEETKERWVIRILPQSPTTQQLDVCIYRAEWIHRVLIKRVLYGCQPYWFRGCNLLNEGHTVLNWFAEADTARLLSPGASLTGKIACLKQGHKSHQQWIPNRINCCI